jgi:hypothetical protein
MSEQTLLSIGSEALFSHGQGTVAIIGAFATPGIECTSLYISPHNEGVGDHRFHVHDFDAGSVLGTIYSKWICPAERALHCGVEQTVKKYNEVLHQLTIQHRSFEKIEYLHRNHGHLNTSEFLLMFNAGYKELTQLMLGLEKRCNKFRDGSIDFSPVVGLWIRCLQAYRWMGRYLAGLVPHPGNLFCLCRRLSISSPNSLLAEEVSALEAVCIQKLADLMLAAPALQNGHLRSCLKLVQAKGDKVATDAIIGIL